MAVSLAASLGAATSPGSADACTLATGVFRRDVWPRPGSQGVPLNSRVVVVYEALFAEVPEAVELRGPDGALVPVTVTRSSTLEHEVLVLTPGAALRPATTYAVLDRFELHTTCTDFASGCLGDPVEVATFTTGDAADAAPPALTGVTITSEPVDGLGMCSPDPAVRYPITIGGATPDVALYNYYDRRGRLVAGPLPIADVGDACGDDGSLLVDVDVGGPVFELRAVDLAGNESAGHTLRGRSCDDVHGGGCSAGGGAGLLVGVAALAGLRRRRATT